MEFIDRENTMLCKQGVTGSIPVTSTNFLKDLWTQGEFLLEKVGILFVTMVWLVSVGLWTQASRLPAGGPQCETQGTSDVTISCSYSAAATAPRENSAPPIALKRAVISFKPASESHMHVELTFSNESDAKITEKRTIYIAFDDAKGENHMRRPLPHVDFTKLEPHSPMTFEERLLAPAFEPGIYSISLWIPSNDAAVKFDPAHNFLLSDEGVPDNASGLNRIAQFTAAAPSRRRKSSLPD